MEPIKEIRKAWRGDHWRVDVKVVHQDGATETQQLVIGPHDGNPDAMGADAADAMVKARQDKTEGQGKASTGSGGDGDSGQDGEGGTGNADGGDGDSGQDGKDGEGKDDGEGNENDNENDSQQDKEQDGDATDEEKEQQDKAKSEAPQPDPEQPDTFWMVLGMAWTMIYQPTLLNRIAKI